MIRSVKGTHDILPDQTWRWRKIESALHNFMQKYGYQEIRTPAFEKTELFLRGVGATSDIASKELYTFLDKAKRSMSLRPEGTASVMRAFIEHNLSQEKKFHKLYYMGPMFRYDRPQKGRYRQHHQLGIEVIGDKSFEIDAEVIDMLMTLFKRLELTNLKLLINSIGDLETRANYKKALLDFLKPNFENLSEDSKARFEKNPMRILDSKDERDKKILKDRSEEHTSELQSHSFISYAVFCLKKKTTQSTKV